MADEIRFEWDEEKNEINYKKHGVSFETAVLVFEDPNRLMFVERFENNEERWHAIGAIRGSLLFITVVHTYREAGTQQNRANDLGSPRHPSREKTVC